MRDQGSPVEKKQNNFILIIFVLVLVIVMAVVVILAMNRQKTAAGTTGQESESIVSDTETVSEKWQEGVITYNGKKYQLNRAISTYLYLGIDKDEKVAPAKDAVSGGQADAQFLLIVNDKTKTLSVLAINRNTMTDIEVYDEEGNSLGKHRFQICLQHGFGDGMRGSCNMSVDAVSNLLYGMPINGYFAMNMGGLVQLNDAVGGVTVDVMQDIEDENKGVSLKEGETVTLNGDEAYDYIRVRDTSVFDSSTARLNRQIQYITALTFQMKALGVNKAMEIYDSVSDYVVTNIEMNSLAEKVWDCKFDTTQVYHIPGETVMGDEYEEYNVDEDALYQMIIDIFYEPVE